MSKEFENRSPEIDLAPILKIMMRNFRLIFFSALAFGILVGLWASLIKDPYYRVSAVLTPQESASLSGSLSRLISNNGLGDLLNLTKGNEGMNNYLGILQSQALAEAVAKNGSLFEKFGISVVPSSDSFAERRALVIAASLIQGRTQITTTKLGMIRIDFVDTDPQRALDVVNAYLTELQNFLAQYSSGRAKNTELFIRERLEDYSKSLSQAEESFLETLKKKGVVSFPGQLQVSLNTASQLRSKIIEKEMEIELYRNVINDSSELRRLEGEKIQLQKQIDKLMTGDSKGTSKSASGSGQGSKSSDDLFTPLNRAQETGAIVGAAQREYTSAIKIVELLRQQYELARIESKKEEPRFQLIDPPTYPLFPAGPNWKLQSVAAFSAMFILMAFLVIFSGHFKKGPRALLKIVRTPPEIRKSR